MRRRAALALVALGFIAAVTASWWALALWPLPATTPVWLARAREVCFGNTGQGLPSVGGWVLLVGEPVGMLAILFVVWGDAVQEGLRALRGHLSGRLLLAASAVGLLSGAAWAAERVREAREAESFDVRSGAGMERLDEAAPPLRLIDQAGDTIAPSGYAGRPVVVAFAYGHCETVCPVIVRDLVSAVNQLGASAPEVLIVTLDPWRDTPARLGSIARAWGLPSGVHVLSGEVRAVERTLDAWQVPRTRDPASGELTHSRLAYLLGPNGRLAYRLDAGVEAVVSAVAAVPGLKAAVAGR